MKNLKKHTLNFSKYLSVGLIATLISVLLSWILIDFFDLTAVISTFLVTLLVFFFKYWGYLRANLIKKSFLRYVLIHAVSAFFYIFFAGVFIDVLLLNTLFSLIFIEALLFILRFLAFYFLKMIKN